MTTYEVQVTGAAGVAYLGTNLTHAAEAFANSVRASMRGLGKAAGEDVILFSHGNTGVVATYSPEQGVTFNANKPAGELVARAFCTKEY